MNQSPKSAASVAKEIKRRNRVFSAATKAQRRVLLAQDVIDQIKAAKFVAETGRWVSLSGSWTLGDDTSVQRAILQNDIPECQVCALGSLITSCVLFKNKITIGDYVDEKMDWCNGQHEARVTEEVGLRTVFSVAQLRLIEQAFEQGGGFYSGRLTDQDEVAIKFGKRYSSDNERLTAIMQNIVAHKGWFIP